MNKKLLWTIVSLVVLIVLFVTLKKTGVIGKEDGLTVSAEKAAMRTIIETVNASGKVYPEIEVKVSPDISGEIVELNVNEGDSVTKGQVLARIYADIYSTQRDQVAAGVNQARAQLANSSASIVGLKATLDNAKQVYDRQLKLYNDKVTSRQEFEQAQQALRSAEANYNGAKEGLKGTQAAISGAEAQLARANKDLSRTTLVAPMNGIISLLAVKKGERVVGTAQMAGTEMMRVADMRSIEIRVDVGENDIPKVKIPGIDGEIRDLYQIVRDTFKNPAAAFGYTFFMVFIGFHLRHGIWSALQSLGAMKPKLSPIIYTIAGLLATLIAIGFLSIPLYIYFTTGM